MSETIAWPSVCLIQTDRLDLEALRVEHAQEAATLFNDTRLHTFTGGSPAALDELVARYARLSAGQSPDGSQAWLNWLVRDRSIGRLVGTVQATVERSVPDRLEAELAWVIGVAHQNKGYGRDAAFAMATWLRDQGVAVLHAHIHPSHGASAALASALGMIATDIRIDGEVCWTSV